MEDRKATRRDTKERHKRVAGQFCRVPLLKLTFDLTYDAVVFDNGCPSTSPRRIVFGSVASDALKSRWFYYSAIVLVQTLTTLRLRRVGVFSGIRFNQEAVMYQILILAAASSQESRVISIRGLRQLSKRYENHPEW